MEPEGPGRVERRLAAILAADVVGYSRLIGADEEGTLGRLKALRAEAIDPKIAGHRGRIVKTTGDGLLVEFASVVDALRCAGEIQAALAESNAPLPPDRRIEFRIGLHQGDVVAEDGDIFGDGVNVAARLEALAEPGGICVSARVQEDAAGRLDLPFEDIGEQALKNIGRPVRVYRVHGAGAARSQSTPVQAAIPLPDKPSIAVLPFQNMSGDPEQDYFADGMVEEIITALSRIRQIFVIARNSTFTYKGQAIDVKQVGRELGVRYVLEGSVRKGGNRVRITAQLIEAETGAHLWADRFDGSMEDIFDLQDQVATSVAGVIEPALQAAETRRATARPTNDLTAYDLYLRSFELFLAWSKEPTLHALDLLARAIERDPRYGLALAMAGFCHSLLFCSGWADDPEATRRMGIELAQRALQVAAADPVALASVSIALVNFDQDVEPIIGLIDRSLALNPGSARGWGISGWIRVVAGDSDRAIRDFATAERLDPRSPSRPFNLTGVGIAHFLAHRLDEAASMLRASMQLLPSYVTNYYYLASCYAHMSRHDDAREIFRRLTVLTPLAADPPVIMSQRPEQRAFFLAGYRLAMGETT
jgi:TolB-like protein/class 3 adenylate cyclase/tetratricopeptide (TPR) repeat protein